MKISVVKAVSLLSLFSWQAAKADTHNLTLDELKAKCHEFENNSQIMKFNSSFVCSESKSFWVVKGQREVNLSTSSSVKIKALIKDDRHQTDWWEVPGGDQNQVAYCPVVEQWTATARATVAIKSCDQLDQISDEASFCSERLADTWRECEVERQQAMSAGGFDLPKAPLCQYQATGVEKSCNSDGPVRTPDQTCQQGGKDHHDQCATTTTSSSSSSSDDDDAIDHVQELFGTVLGASLRETVVKRKVILFIKSNHKVIMVDSPVAEGSLLARLGLKQGDMISRVNDERVKDPNSFVVLLKRAKASGSALIDYKPVDSQKFVEKRVSL